MIPSVGDTVLQGTTVRAKVTFLDSAGTATDPTAIALHVKAPGTAAATYTFALGQVTKASVGVYYKDLDTTSAAGLWQFYYLGTGALVASSSGEFQVQPLPF